MRTAMRGRLLAGTALVLALAGCAPELPAGVDRQLGDDWPGAFPAAQGYVPAVGTCSDSGGLSTVGNSFDTFVDCAEWHYAEATYVGSFPAATAKVTATRLAEALAECDRGTDAYLAGTRAWWDGRLLMRVTVPTPWAWAGGARWFRCEVTEINLFASFRELVKRSGSLKAVFPETLRVTCVQDNSNSHGSDSIFETPCSNGHNAEYVGSYRESVRTAAPVTEKQWSALWKRCESLAARYIGVSAATASRYGIIPLVSGSEDWEQGNRVVRCLVWFEEKSMKTSVKGTKGRGLPS